MNVNVNNVALNVRIEGNGEPFIWAHGLSASMFAEDAFPWIKWGALTDVLKLVRYDARGHGDLGASDSPADYQWSALAHDMLALADQVGFDTFIAGGQSMGCATSIYAALAAPQRIRGLVLMNVPTAWETRAAQAGLYGQMVDAIEARGLDFFAAMMQQQPAAIPAWQLEAYPDMAAGFGDALKLVNPKTLVTVLRGAQKTDLPPREALEAIQAPALVLAWTDDPGHPVSSAEEVAHRLPNARLLVASSAAEIFTWTDEIRAFVTSLS